MQICPSARKFLNGQTSDTIREIIDRLLWLDQNPHLTPDDPRKRPFEAPPVVLRIFQEGKYWAIYYLQNNELMVANVGDHLEYPHLWRRD